jgi:hypothetical protein
MAEIGSLSCGRIKVHPDRHNGGDEGARKTGRGRVVDNACGDDEDDESYEDSGVGGVGAGGWQCQGEDGEAGFKFSAA